MGKEETKTEVPGPAANGTSLLEKSAEAVAEKTGEENNGVKEMEEDKKGDENVETEKMDKDQKVKENKQSKEEMEQPKTEAMEEETDLKENDKKIEKEEKKDEVEEKLDGLKEEEEEEESKEVKGSKKRGKVQKTGEIVKGKTKKVEEEPEQRTPLTDRPVRQRKSVERLVASIDKDASREFQIEKGRGIPLKDIPNVAFKLSRRKTDDTFRLLHTILYGRRGKAVQIKSNISRFSGFVWHENEEKQKNKVKEKFDKCNKEKLLEFCDVLDMPITKATTRKEDIVAKLIDFLVAPHVTTTVLISEKEKSSMGKKRKRVVKSGATSKRSTKSRRKSQDAPKSGKRSKPDLENESEEEEEEEEEEKEEEENEEEKIENGVTEKSEDEMPEDSESVEKNESEEDAGKKKSSTKVSSRKNESAGKAKTKKVTVPKRSAPEKRTKVSSSKNTKTDDDSEKSPKVSSRKKPEKVTKEKSSTPTKSASKEKTSKKVSKGKDKAKEAKLKPSDCELRATICDILKEVDFDTATFTDILKLLAQQFDTDLTPRKSSIKLMIQEELTKLADEADDGEGDAEKDENQSAGQEVEACKMENNSMEKV